MLITAIICILVAARQRHVHIASLPRQFFRHELAISILHIAGPFPASFRTSLAVVHNHILSIPEG